MVAFQSFARRVLGKTPLTEISAKTSPKHEFMGHQDWSFIFLHDNIHLVSGSSDSTMRKWDCETGLLVGEPWRVGNAVHGLALSPDGKTIACGRGDGTVQRWDTNGQQMEGIWTVIATECCRSRGLPADSHLASGSLDGTLFIRKGESGEAEIGPIETNQGYVLSAAYSPSEDRITSGGTSRFAYGTCIVWSLDGNKLHSAGSLAGVVSDSTSGTELRRFQHDDWLYSIAISPKHDLPAGVGSGGIAQLWDTVLSATRPAILPRSPSLRSVILSRCAIPGIQ